MTTMAAEHVYHVQSSLDPTTFALMCPWRDCGHLSIIRRDVAGELGGRRLNCAACGMPSRVPANVEELCS